MNTEQLQHYTTCVGIYKITAPDGYYYIGSTINFSRRLKKHFNSLVKNCHPNARMQNKFNKYPEGWIFEIIQPTTREELHIVEQLFLNKHCEDPLCMNLCKSVTAPMYNRKHTQIARDKIKNANLGKTGYWKGKTKSETSKQKASDKLKGVPRSESVKNKISASRKGYKEPLDVIAAKRARMKEYWRLKKLANS